MSGKGHTPTKDLIGCTRQSRTKAERDGRRTKVMNLRLQGYTYQEIADELGYADASGPYHLVKQIREEQVAKSAETHEEVLHLELERLDKILRVAWSIAQGPSVPAAVRLQALDRVIRAQERRARYLGLDAPIKVSGSVDVTTHSELDAEIESLMADLRRAEQEEATAAAASGTAAEEVRSAPADPTS